MMEVINLDQEVVLANGNRMKNVDYLKIKEPAFYLNSPEVRRKLQEHKEDLIREKQFAELVLHVLEKIQKESNDEFNEKIFDEKMFWPEVCLLDMKKFLNEDVSVCGVSENSPIFVLDSVTSKVGQVLHNFNIFEIGQLAACTRAELNHIIKQAREVQSTDLEFAVHDAKSVVNILSSVANEAKKSKEETTWGSWGLAQVTDMLHIKDNSKKIANIVGSLSPKHITASIVEVFAGPNLDGDDIGSFQEI